MLPALDFRLQPEEELEREMCLRNLEQLSPDDLRELCRSLVMQHFTQRRVIRTLVKHKAHPP
jgi:hypothetical protein